MIIASFLADDGKRYNLHRDGHIGQRHGPTRGWHFVALVHLHPFGHEVERLTLPAVVARIPWEWKELRHSTGSPKWRLRDRWRGKERVWSRSIMWIRGVEL